MTDEILDLQATAGNRSVAAAIGEASVQRDTANAPRNDGGVLSLDGDEAIPFQSASWSITQPIAVHNLGPHRGLEISGKQVEYGNLKITRVRDDKSPRVEEILQPRERATGRLEINQPSADGGLPATRLDLAYVGFQALTEPKGNDTVELISLYVERFTVAGLITEKTKAHDRAKAAAVASLSLDGNRPTPIVRFESKGRRQDLEAGSHGARSSGPADPLTVTLVIPAGSIVDRLVASLEGKRRFDATITPVGSGVVLELRDALLTEVKSTSDPSLVEVALTSEVFREQQRSKE